MQNILNGNTTALYQDFISPDVPHKDLWNNAEAIANVILNPDEKNNFGITGDMKNKNACFGQKCEWVDIEPGQNGDPNNPKSFYYWIASHYQKWWWIYIDIYGNYNILLTTDEMNTYCGGSCVNQKNAPGGKNP